MQRDIGGTVTVPRGSTVTGNVTMERTVIRTVPRECSGIGNVPRGIAGKRTVCRDNSGTAN